MTVSTFFILDIELVCLRMPSFSFRQREEIKWKKLAYHIFLQSSKFILTTWMYLYESVEF
jgi:hypothetical protein